MPIPNTNTLLTQSAIGYGSAFSIGVTVTGVTTYTEVLEITKLSYSGFTVAVEDATNLGSPNATMEHIPGMINPGTLSIDGNYIDDATQQLILTNLSARTVFPFKIQSLLGNGKTLTISGQGFFTEMGLPTFEPGKIITFSNKMTLTGTTTFVSA